MIEEEEDEPLDLTALGGGDLKIEDDEEAVVEDSELIVSAEAKRGFIIDSNRPDHVGGISGRDLVAAMKRYTLPGQNTWVRNKDGGETTKKEEIILPQAKDESPPEAILERLTSEELDAAAKATANFRRAAFDIDMDAIDDRPWLRPDADPSDYFNYGMNESSWRSYVKQQLLVRRELQERRVRINAEENGLPNIPIKSEKFPQNEPRPPRHQQFPPQPPFPQRPPPIPPPRGLPGQHNNMMWPPHPQPPRPRFQLPVFQQQQQFDPRFPPPGTTNTPRFPPLPAGMSPMQAMPPALNYYSGSTPNPQEQKQWRGRSGYNGADYTNNGLPANTNPQQYQDPTRRYMNRPQQQQQQHDGGSAAAAAAADDEDSRSRSRDRNASGSSDTKQQRYRR